MRKSGARHGFVSLNDVIAFLIHVYHQHELLVRMIRRNHTDTSSIHTDMQGTGTFSTTYTDNISTSTDREGIHTGYISMDTSNKASFSSKG